MSFTDFKELFIAALQKNKILPLTDEQIKTFYDFTAHLMEVNSHTNLTAIRSIEDIIDKHYADCLTASEHIPQGATVLDLGCGPGFPSVPLAIARPDLLITALDSTDKKIRFIKESVTLLGLTNLIPLCGRAEDAKIRKEIGQKDVVVSRAVAKMSVLSELCLPYVKISGKLIAMKGAKADEELDEARKGIQILGGDTPAMISLELALNNDTTEQRALIVVPKIKQTPPTYPRAYAAILKKPL